MESLHSENAYHIHGDHNEPPNAAVAANFTTLYVTVLTVIRIVRKRRKRAHPLGGPHPGRVLNRNIGWELAGRNIHDKYYRIDIMPLRLSFTTLLSQWRTARHTGLGSGTDVVYIVYVPRGKTGAWRMVTTEREVTAMQEGTCRFKEEKITLVRIPYVL